MISFGRKIAELNLLPSTDIATPVDHSLHPALYVSPFVIQDCAHEHHSFDSTGSEIHHLVGNQKHEGRDDDGAACGEEARELIHERKPPLASLGGSQLRKDSLKHHSGKVIALLEVEEQAQGPQA